LNFRAKRICMSKARQRQNGARASRHRFEIASRDSPPRFIYHNVGLHVDDSDFQESTARSLWRTEYKTSRDNACPGCTLLKRTVTSASRLNSLRGIAVKLNRRSTSSANARERRRQTKKREREREREIDRPLVATRLDSRFYLSIIPRCTPSRNRDV